MIDVSTFKHIEVGDYVKDNYGQIEKVVDVVKYGRDRTIVTAAGSSLGRSHIDEVLLESEVNG